MYILITFINLIISSSSEEEPLEESLLCSDDVCADIKMLLPHPDSLGKTPREKTVNLSYARLSTI